MPLVALSIQAVTTQRADLAAVADSNLASQAHLQSRAASNILDQAAEAVKVLAANPTLQDAHADGEGTREQLEAYEMFEEVTLLHPSGAVIETTNFGFTGRWDANAAFRGALEGRSIMTPPLFYTDPERLVVEFAAPVFDDTGILSVVVASMNMSRIWQLLDDTPIGQTGFFAVFDTHGNVIGHPDKTLLLRKIESYPVTTLDGGRGPVEFRMPDGTAMVGHAQPVGSTGWHVAALQAESEAYALANDAVARTMFAAGFVLLLAVTLALVVSRAISGPMRSVGSAMRRVAEGDLEQHVAATGLDEIDSLAGSFNAMTGQLGKRSEELRAEGLERERAEERIRHQAYHDSLTGLPNRLLLKDRLDMALAAARRSGEPLAVMFLDLDRFKLVNDSVGHTSGDQLLLGVSDRLTASVREGDSVARVGGDEYVLLLPQVQGPERAIEAAQRVLGALRSPWQLHGRDFRVTASVGIAMHPKDGADAETLMRNADTAMYQAKEEGRDGIRLFEAEMDESIQERVTLDEDLRRAFLLEQFVLHYQPQVDIDSGQIVGLEALLRWQSPERGLVAPGEFIPLAEETGLIWDLGRWVLETACNQVQSWREAGLVDRIVVAVNVSPRQFHDVGIVDVVRNTLDATGLPPAQLELEITEGTAMRDVEHSVRTLTALKEMGVRVSIDDFGTGYSSLSYLKRFPVDAVKIDRSFVMDIASDPDDAAIVAAVIALAKSLDMGTVAEGVETEEQLAFLMERRCPSFQGFIFSRALPAQEIPELFAKEMPSESEPRDATQAAVGPGFAFGQ